MHRIASDAAWESAFLSQEKRGPQGQVTMTMAQIVLPDKYRTPAKSELQGIIVWHKDVSNVAWDMLTLKKYVLFF